MIYLDNNATTIIDPSVAAVMLPFFQGWAGNPSSTHAYGQKAKALLTEATRYCAGFFGVTGDEILFTSGATEGLNFLVHNLPKNSQIITSTIEHSAVFEPLVNSGCLVSSLDPEPLCGSISLRQIKEVFSDQTSAIILSSANNETGIITTDLNAIADFALQQGILLIVDGVAHLGKEDFNFHPGISAACFSGHKIHGPLGIGLTIVRKSFKVKPMILGGSQQRGFRAGTENLSAIVGFAQALKLLSENSEEWIRQMATLRDLFEQKLMERIPDLYVHGKTVPRVCNTSNIAFPKVNGESLLITLDLNGVAASHGSACSSGAIEPSRVLLNMGVSSKITRSSIRFSLSRFTTEEEILKSIEIITQLVKNLSL